MSDTINKKINQDFFLRLHSVELYFYDFPVSLCPVLQES